MNIIRLERLKEVNDILDLFKKRLSSTTFNELNKDIRTLMSIPKSEQPISESIFAPETFEELQKTLKDKLSIGLKIKYAKIIVDLFLDKEKKLLSPPSKEEFKSRLKKEQLLMVQLLQHQNDGKIISEIDFEKILSTSLDDQPFFTTSSTSETTKRIVKYGNDLIDALYNLRFLYLYAEPTPIFQQVYNELIEKTYREILEQIELKENTKEQIDEACQTAYNVLLQTLLFYPIKNKDKQCDEVQASITSITEKMALLLRDAFVHKHNVPSEENTSKLLASTLPPLQAQMIRKINRITAAFWPYIKMRINESLFTTPPFRANVFLSSEWVKVLNGAIPQTTITEEQLFRDKEKEIKLNLDDSACFGETGEMAPTSTAVAVVEVEKDPLVAKLLAEKRTPQPDDEKVPANDDEEETPQPPAAKRRKELVVEQILSQ